MAQRSSSSSTKVIARFGLCGRINSPISTKSALAASVITTLGANQQKALKFHGILANLLTTMVYRRFLIFQILTAFNGSFVRAYNPMESTIFSSEKSYSPCKLKWLHRMTESFRMASMSSFLRSSLLSLPSSFAR
jgi:hypothetical protein